MRLSAKTLLVTGAGAALIAIVLLPIMLIAKVTPSWYPEAEVANAQIAAFDGGVIRYQERGEGDSALLLLHGFNAEMVQWDGVWKRIEGHGGRQVRIDIPGFGASSWKTADFGLPAQGQRIMALLDRLGIRQVTLAGTSMGASLSAWIAAQYPDRVRQVVLMAPSGYPGSLQYSGLYGRLLQPGKVNRMAGWVVRTRLYSSVFSRSRAAHALTVTASYGEPWQAALGRIRAPTLLVWSSGDTTADYAAAAANVNREIQGSVLITLDAATGHSIPNTRPALAAEIISRAADGLPPEAITAQLPADVWRAGEFPPTGR
jgi:pimeloyl-ACP methyl ester carboxylesterase